MSILFWIAFSVDTKSYPEYYEQQWPETETSRSHTSKIDQHRAGVDYEQSLFFLGPSSKSPETRKWPRAWLKARDGRGRPRFSRLRRSTLARACTPLTKSEEKERLLSQSSAGAVGREGLVHSIPVLTPEYSLSSQWVLPLRYQLTLHRNVSQLRPVTEIAPKPPFLCEQRRVAFSRVGWFSRALAFRSLYYSWGKMGDYS